MTTTDETTTTSRAQKVLVLIGIVVLAFNLRPAAVSIGPVLDETCLLYTSPSPRD